MQNRRFATIGLKKQKYFEAFVGKMAKFRYLCVKLNETRTKAYQRLYVLVIMKQANHY